MAFKDYSLTPASNTAIGEDTFIGPNMPRDNVRPALQQIAADGRDLYEEMLARGELATFLASGTGAVERTALAKMRERLSVIDFAPNTMIANAIAAGTHAADIVSWVDAASDAAVAQGRILHFPAGTYPMEQWLPPANLEVSTDGLATIFKQLDTGGYLTRFIDVQADGVRLWPGGIATIDGNMNNTPINYGVGGDGFLASVPGRNATSMNSGIRVHAGAGVTINSFTCGDVYGVNIGGDVLETGASGGGYLGHCSIGTLYGDNIYRHILAVTAGYSGRVEGVVQEGGVGLYAVDVEPDPSSSSPPMQWHIEFVRGNRMSVAGDAAEQLGSFTYGTIDIDYDRGASVPPFSYDTTEGAAPATFQVGLRYRNVRSIVGKSLVIRNHQYAAIRDLGEGGGDTPCKEFKVDYCEVENCGEDTGYEVLRQKTNVMQFGSYISKDKPAANPASFGGGAIADGWLNILAGEIDGKVVHNYNGNIAIGKVLNAGPADTSAFYNITGKIELNGLKSSGALFLFQGCTEVPICVNCDLDVAGGGGQAIVSGGAGNAQYVRCKIRGADINLGWFSAAALSDAANDAAAAALGTPVQIGEVYRNGSVLMVRVS